MRNFIIILFLIISNLVFAQDNVYRIFIGESQYNVLKEQYVEGSVELINGKKIKGLINKNLTEPILKVINGDTATYNGNEIKEFKLKDQSKIISTIVNGKQMFLQIRLRRQPLVYLLINKMMMFIFLLFMVHGSPLRM